MKKLKITLEDAKATLRDVATGPDSQNWRYSPAVKALLNSHDELLVALGEMKHRAEVAEQQNAPTLWLWEHIGSAPYLTSISPESDPEASKLLSEGWTVRGLCDAIQPFTSGQRMAEAATTAPIVPAISSTEVNDAAWKLHNMLTEHGPLNGHQFNNLKGCFYEALKVCMGPNKTLQPALADVVVERQRQISAKGYHLDHDDTHINDEIAALAAWYVMPPGAREWNTTSTGYGDTLGEAILPGWNQPSGKDRRRELVIGAALTIAEIERLDRAAANVEVEGV